MPRRPFLTAAALLAALPLASCNNSSPEAGRPDTAPPSASPTPSATASTPQWTPEQTKAITEAKARYAAARAAVDKALLDPRQSSRAPLEQAGNGGTWLIAVIDQVRFQRQQGWHRVGNLQIAKTTVAAVNLDLEQPEVKLTNCIDSSKTKTLVQSTGAPVPLVSGDGNRKTFNSRLVYAPNAKGGAKSWFLVEDQVAGPC
ncbi:hypothetical protein [Kribbella sp. NPDC051770]|uniref:hypothetical protein n=1 Tax=Kribbella sp. NPDC051770 TaxID=3155413 RepID=UPI0034128D66